ncbi:MAG: hypothetical protein FWD13_03915 [Treponema sp.]|nr:hypothetical protein [Treponema sp.]
MFKKLPKKTIAFLLVFCSMFIFFGCTQRQIIPFSYVGERSGQSIYLDGQKGKVIFIDETNRIIDYVDLRPNSADILIIENNKMEALKNLDRGSNEIAGTVYSIKLSTRFYSNRLLYIMRLEPHNDEARRFAGTISIELMDLNGFILGKINPTNDWTNIVDNTGERIALETQGSIPITLRNYLEIVAWEPLWTRN